MTPTGSGPLTSYPVYTVGIHQRLVGGAIGGQLIVMAGMESMYWSQMFGTIYFIFFTPFSPKLLVCCNYSMGLGEAKVETSILRNMTRLAAYLTHCSLNPKVSRANVLEETLFD
jgi:hypothetical protein